MEHSVTGQLDAMHALPSSDINLQGGINVSGNSFSFPVAFPKAILAAVAVIRNNGSSSGHWDPSLTSANKTSANYWYDYGGRSWIVLGY